MFRFLFAAALLALSSVHGAYAATITADSSNQFHVYRGLVSSTRPCGQTGIALTLDQSTTTLLFLPSKTLIFPAGATPQTGQRAFAIAGATTTCDIDQGAGVLNITVRTLSYISSSVAGTASTTGTQPQTGSQNGGTTSGSGQIQGLFNQLLGSGTQALSGALQKILNPTPAGGGASTGSAGAAAGALSACLVINFGGPVVSPPIFCTSPPGAALVYVGPPVAKPLMCLQGPNCMETPNQYGPPLIPGQQALGCHAPAMVPCFVGHVMVGLGFPVVAVGTSLPGAPAAAPAKPAPSAPSPSCASAAGIDTSTAAGKATAEAQMRQELSKCGISVKSSQTNGAPCAVGEDGVKNGCTDVSGLQCSTIAGLCDLAKVCPFSVYGGSEAGHDSHKNGTEVDATMDPACVAKNFTALDTTGCRYIDKATGTTFRNEAVCKAPKTTGPHFHICINGKNC